MQSTGDNVPSARRLWSGRILASIAVLFLIFDGVIKLAPIQPVVEGFAHLGYPIRLAPVIGVLELILIAIYLIPRASLLGAILLTGFLGGAIASQVRIGEPLFSHVLFPTYIAALLWGGLFLREGRLRALLPLRSEPAPSSRTPARESVPRAEVA